MMGRDKRGRMEPCVVDEQRFILPGRYRFIVEDQYYETSEDH